MKRAENWVERESKKVEMEAKKVALTADLWAEMRVEHGCDGLEVGCFDGWALGCTDG